MTIKIVNSSPGDTTSPYVPGDPLLVGMRSTTAKVDPTSISYDLALSAFINNGVLPENDSKLTDAGASVSIVSPELEQPFTGEISRSISNGSLVLTKVGAGAQDQSIYSVTTPVRTGASVLAHIRIRINSAWQSINPDWCNLINLKGLYFGLEYGPLNTATYAFLRDDGANGSIVVGGPQPGPTLARPAQTEITTLDSGVAGVGWKTLANGSTLDLFILFNTYTNPNVVEIWASRPADGTLNRIAYDLVDSLGTFPVAGSGSNNVRSGPSNTATLFFGLTGLNGDVLQIDDWAIYPEYQRLALAGTIPANSSMQLSPNGPVVFTAADGALLSRSKSARWLPLSDGLPMKADLFFQPGLPNKPLHTRLYNEGSRAGFQRNEPRLESRSEGAMIEAVLSGVTTSRNGSGTSLGIGIEDGLKSYRYLLVDDPNLRTLGLLTNENLADSLSGYTNVGGVNWTVPQLVRLTVDRSRSQIVLYAGNETVPVGVLPLNSAVPASAGPTGRMMVGALAGIPAEGQLNLQKLLYLTRYNAWEGRDGFLPTNIGLPPGSKFSGLSSGAGFAAMSGTSVSITKPDFNTPASNYYFSKLVDFNDRHGLLVDFQASVPTYTDANGTPNAPLVDLCAGLRCFLGNRVVQVSFFDCGVAGKKVGILSGSGQSSDIVNQTSLGVKYSASVDWTVPQNYRLVMKPYESIQLWIGSLQNEPAITIPWVNDQFDIKISTSPAAIEFGHFGSHASSVSNWGYVRWGLSDGYDVTMTPEYPDGRSRFLFGGKIYSAINFSELP